MSGGRINDGGPAFPLAHVEAVAFAQAAEDCANPKLDAAERTYCEARRNALGGMSLRDYFAARAPAVPTGFPRLTERKVVARPGGGWQDGHVDEEIEKQQARWAYRYADAMLKARTA